MTAPYVLPGYWEPGYAEGDEQNIPFYQPGGIYFLPKRIAPALTDAVEEAVAAVPVVVQPNPEAVRRVALAMAADRPQKPVDAAREELDAAIAEGRQRLIRQAAAELAYAIAVKAANDDDEEALLLLAA